MKRRKKYINIIAQILLVISIMLSVLAIFINSIVLNKNTYLNILSKEGTYAQIKQSVYDKIDTAIGSKNIGNDVKEQIITEDDIRNEADNVITGLVQYLKTGENNVAPINTEIYKQRITKILNTIVNNLVSPSKDDLSFNNNIDIQPTNVSFYKYEPQSEKVIYMNNALQYENKRIDRNKLSFDNMMVVKDNSKYGQDSISMERLMTSSEAQSKIKSILKEKGLTEEQARQKMAEKGITDEQALKILQGYGITIDDAPQSSSSNNSSATTSKGSQSKTSQQTDNGNNNTNSSVTTSDNQSQTSGSVSNGNQSQTADGTYNSMNQDSSNAELSGQNNEKIGSVQNDSNGESKGVSFIDKLKGEIINSIITDDGTSTDQKLNTIKNTLLDEVGTRIDNEIQKINLNKLMESNKLQAVAKITSIFYKMFWAFMIMPIILILALIKLNNGKVYLSLRSIGSAFLVSGLILFTVFFGGYISKFYENINVNTVYFKDVIAIIMKHFLINLWVAGVITSVIGLLLLTPMIKKNFINKVR
ncbi:hypothetical protein [Clostridium saccharobutylicum]|uniref:Uncharacterized protein n=1 Tax=Clostridium saccharobutylicum DSM 13864 TaxID=1345695 RepID=U5N063_CLOSA|nr:hypothetical protein [Clostridium saccharobutylicum]AGX45177.1 hypothetical protein CLSA_c42170 [Clostridium saccharobutylicum DSM 13864]AQR92455.1 hypothetical protein CLOSC_41850 [Clostridium saccharobutylicum]AQS02358.1 hypothetical protein CSACC_41910 [Clostridium saccharobutylicum]AQS16341.1 hypothetical protein CLOSACC_41910 [Clostridium saccharobutylicum]MBA2905020.1 hypothetical protein [Clostridium saccharobutylicum]